MALPDLLRVVEGGDLKHAQSLASQLSPEELQRARGPLAPRGRTLLHLAAAGGREALCAWLIADLGLGVNAQDEEGEWAGR